MNALLREKYSTYTIVYYIEYQYIRLYYVLNYIIYYIIRPAGPEAGDGHAGDGGPHQARLGRGQRGPNGAPGGRARCIVFVVVMYVIGNLLIIVLANVCLCLFHHYYDYYQ